MEKLIRTLAVGRRDEEAPLVQRRADEDENRAVLHVLVMRVLYELWELCSAISAANAILMYASELMLERVMKLSNALEHFYSRSLWFVTC